MNDDYYDNKQYDWGEAFTALRKKETWYWLLFWHYHIPVWGWTLIIMALPVGYFLVFPTVMHAIFPPCEVNGLPNPDLNGESCRTGSYYFWAD